MQKVILNLACFKSFIPSFDVLERSKRVNLLQALMVTGFLTMLVLAVLFIGTGVNNALAPTGSHDFQWTPSKDVVDGVNPYRDFISWQEQGHDSVPQHFLNQSPSYPASTYILLSPFAALVLAFLIASPLRTSLGAGQHNFISLAAFVWAYYYAHNGKNKGLSGLLLSIAWIKYSLTFPLTIIFLRRGGIKPVIIAATTHAVLTCIVAWRIGMWPHEFFFSSVQVVLMGDGTGFLNLIAISMNFDLPLPVPLTLIGLATLGVAYVLYRNHEADPLTVMAFLGLFSCAVFYHHGYDFVVLLLCAWALAQGRIQGAIKYATICLLSIAWFVQWFTQELAGQLGPYPAICADALLIAVFYYTVYLFAKALYLPQVKLKPATAVSF